MKLFFKNILPSSMKHFLYKTGCFLVKDLDEYGLVHPSMEWSINNLKKLGYNPRSIVDIGAYQGKWTEMVKTIFPTSRVLMIEAQSDKEIYLKKVKKQFGKSVDYCLNLLASKSNEQVVFNEMESGSSVLEEQSSIPRKKITCQTQTLDSITSKFDFNNTDLLKLDVQGYELEVLKGATKTLNSVNVILMEVALLRINKGAPVINEVLSFMEQKNFVPYDVCSLIRRPLDHALWQIDMIFVRENSHLLRVHKYN